MFEWYVFFHDARYIDFLPGNELEYPANVHEKLVNKRFALLVIFHIRLKKSAKFIDNCKMRNLEILIVFTCSQVVIFADLKQNK